MVLYSNENIPAYITIIEAIFNYSKPKYLKKEPPSAHNASYPLAHVSSVTYLPKCESVSLGEQAPEVSKDHCAFLCRIKQNKAHISKSMAQIQVILR